MTVHGYRSQVGEIKYAAQLAFSLAAEKKLRELMERLKSVDAADADNLTAQLKQATDDYAKAIRALRPE